MPGRSRTCDAIVLRTVDYRDADRIVTLLTADLGKVSALARGARGSRRRFGGALEPFCVIRVDLGETRGELWTLTQAQLVRPFPALLADLSRMQLAGAAMELLREATPPEEPDARLFEAATTFFEALSAGVGEELFTAFAVRVASLVGFSPGLDECARCGRRAPEGAAALFDPRRGAIVCRACGGGTHLLSGATRARMSASVGPGFAECGPWSERERDQARDAIVELFQHHLGKPLRALPRSNGGRGR